MKRWCLCADMIVGDVRMGMELLSQLNEGVVWYTGMQDSIKKLKQMCSDFVMTRNIDKQEREAEVVRQDEVCLLCKHGRLYL
jgi:hypothetical protein